jgi:hypothetical protein
MPGIEWRVTCGDLTLLFCRTARYNETYAASEVSWVIVPDILHLQDVGKGLTLMCIMFHPEYVVGLADGEGSFTVYVRNPEISQENRRVRVEPKSYIKLI